MIPAQIMNRCIRCLKTKLWVIQLVPLMQATGWNLSQRIRTGSVQILTCLQRRGVFAHAFGVDQVGSRMLCSAPQAAQTCKVAVQPCGFANRKSAAAYRIRRGVRVVAAGEGPSAR
jgi:hypothetical protein